MQEIRKETSDDMMAAWRATGGALWTGDARVGAGDDDGLQAGHYTRFLFCGDDGLRAAMISRASGYQHCVTDDGLIASGGSQTRIQSFCVDDRLEVAAYSGMPMVC